MPLATIACAMTYPVGLIFGLGFPRQTAGAEAALMPFSAIVRGVMIVCWRITVDYCADQTMRGYHRAIVL